MQFIRRYYVLLLAILVGLGAISACGNDAGNSSLRIFNGEERKQIEDMGGEIRADSDWSSVLEAIVSDSYRAVGVLNEKKGTDDYGTGTVLFAHCEQNMTFEQCAATDPTPAKPHIYSDARWYRDTNGDSRVSVGGELHWRAKVRGVTLDCTSASFQLNPYSIKQVPEALGKFVKNGEAQPGNIEVSFPPNSDPNGPYSMGKVAWECKGS